MNKAEKKVAITFALIFWAVNLIYGIWYLMNGWDQQNAIMAYCSTFNDTDLGWFKYVCGHGVLNFIAGYGAIFPLAAPVVLLVATIIHKGFYAGIERTSSLFWNLLFTVAGIACCLYSSTYFTEQRPLISGLFMLGAILSALSSCVTVYTVIVVVD